MLLSFGLTNSIFPFFLAVSDGVRWEEEIQCKFSACLPTNQGNDIPDFCLYSCYFDSPSTYDIAGHCCLHSCLHANWLGNATGGFSFHFFLTKFMNIILVSPLLYTQLC